MSSTLTVATFNLIATIVGGGVLSVPYAFQKCGGALYGILWMTVAAIFTDQSCSWMCWCAREHQSQSSPGQPERVLSSYGQVGQAAFGDMLEVLISALLFVFLVFVLIAYMVLVKDIWTPVLCSLCFQQVSRDLDLLWGPSVLLAILLLMTPFLLQKTLHALRFNCYIGFASVSTLCLALCYHASHTHNPTNALFTTAFWFKPPNSIQDVLTAFPIIMLSYICHFNVNPIQAALHNPTPKRVQTVIHSSMAGCGLLMTLFGIAGYAYVLNNDTDTTIVQGNILLNAEQQQQQSTSTDLLLSLGRVGCGITIMLAMPVMILPCRQALLEVLDSLLDYYCYHCSNDTDKPTREETPLLPSFSHHAESPSSSLADNLIAHCTATFAIVIVCYITAIKVPGVAIVWSLCGSCMAFSIAFILPAAFYLQIVKRKEFEKRFPVASLPSKAWAWFVLVVSVLAAIVCTTQTITSVLSSH